MRFTRRMRVPPTRWRRCKTAATAWCTIGYLSRALAARCVWYTICLSDDVVIQISQTLRDLLQQRLTTTDQIEIVLLLRRNPGRSWAASEVAAELRSAPESAAMRLFLLASSGLVLFEAAGLPRYRYEPADAALDALLAELDTVYADDPVAVTAIVGAPPPDPIRSFADAFRLKR